jgi:hypothetical protein
MDPVGTPFLLPAETTMLGPALLVLARVWPSLLMACQARLCVPNAIFSVQSIFSTAALGDTVSIAILFITVHDLLRHPFLAIFLRVLK